MQVESTMFAPTFHSAIPHWTKSVMGCPKETLMHNWLAVNSREKHICNQMQRLGSDVAHETKTQFKTPGRNYDKLKALHWHVFGTPGALGKTLRHSAKALYNFVATEEEVLSLLKTQAVGLLQKSIANLSYAPQRFVQEANAWESIVLVFISFMKRIC